MTNSFGCGAGVHSVFLSRHRIALSFDTGLASVPAPGQGVAVAGTPGVSCHARTWCKLPEMARPRNRFPTGAPPTRTKGSTPGRGNATGNAKTDNSDNRSATIGKEHDLAKARRIARFTRFLVAADNFDNCLDSFFRLQPTNNIESLLRIHWLFLPGSGGILPDFFG